MNELTMDRLKENLESLKMKNTLEILDNYLERAVAEKLNVVDVLDHILPKKRNPSADALMRNRFRCPVSPLKKLWTTLIFLSSPLLINAR